MLENLLYVTPHYRVYGVPGWYDRLRLAFGG